jgi:hypothetical protein
MKLMKLLVIFSFAALALVAGINDVHQSRLHSTPVKTAAMLQ